MSEFGKWFAGVLGPIIVGVATFYLTRIPTPPPPPRPPPVTVFEGMVYSGSARVPHALVAVDLKGTGLTNGPVHLPRCGVRSDHDDGPGRELCR